MTKTTMLSIITLTVAMGFALSSALRAQEAPGAAIPQNPGMSDHGHMMGNDMRGMKMMDECGRMMQSMSDRRGSTGADQPKETPSPK